MAEDAGTEPPRGASEVQNSRDVGQAPRILCLLVFFSLNSMVLLTCGYKKYRIGVLNPSLPLTLCSMFSKDRQWNTVMQNIGLN